MNTVLPGRHQGRVWLDCSAGAFRDFNAAAHLRKYSPDTKIVLIVRDPWQVGELSDTIIVEAQRTLKDDNKFPLLLNDVLTDEKIYTSLGHWLSHRTAEAQWRKQDHTADSDLTVSTIAIPQSQKIRRPYTSTRCIRDRLRIRREALVLESYISKLQSIARARSIQLAGTYVHTSSTTSIQPLLV